MSRFRTWIWIPVVAFVLGLPVVSDAQMAQKQTVTFQLQETPAGEFRGGYNEVVAKGTQECMICTDNWGVTEGGIFYFVIDWGGDECKDVIIVEDACVNCHNFEYWQDEEDCGDDGNDLKTFLSAEARDTFVSYHACEQSLCSGGGGGGAEDVVESLISLTQQDRLGDLALTIESSDGLVYFNEERQAIQVVGCTGMVSAHIPLAHEVARHLTSILNTRRPHLGHRQ